MRSRRSQARVVAALLGLGACQELGDDPNVAGTADQVVTDWDRSVDFAGFTSFMFVDGGIEDAPESVGLNVTRVRNAVRREYEELGLEESADADLEVMILTYTEDASSVELDCVPTVYWYGTTGGYNSCAFLQLSRTDVTIGTILIGIGDAARKETVFNAAMQGVADGKEIEARINRAVGIVFDDYPADQSGA